MGWFNQSVDAKVEAKKAELAQLDENIVELTTQIQGLRRERGDYETRDNLQAQVDRLKREKADLELSADRVKEAHDRKLRETEHAVGLQQRTATFEQKKATDEAVLKVREENLAKEREEFNRQLEFNTTQLEKVQTFMQTNFSAVLNRLPTVTVDVNPGSKNGDE